MESHRTKCIFTSGQGQSLPRKQIQGFSDPSGTYAFYYLGNGQYSMSLSAYDRLLHDPYSKISATNVQVSGNTVIITVPESNVTS